jgi:tetratricopeptide (TPR) repeat protein
MTEIESLIDKRKWKQAQQRLYHELAQSPTDHWVWFNLSLAHYEQGQYETALKCAQRAVELRSQCPLALWHYAGSLYMTGHEQQALAIWTILLTLDVEEVAYGECGEGMDAALRLINDVHYRIGRCYQHQGKQDLAIQSFEKYLHNRAHGVESTYDDAPIKALLEKLAVTK